MPGGVAETGSNSPPRAAEADNGAHAAAAPRAAPRATAQAAEAGGECRVGVPPAPARGAAAAEEGEAPSSATRATGARGGACGARGAPTCAPDGTDAPLASSYASGAVGGGGVGAAAAGETEARARASSSEPEAGGAPGACGGDPSRHPSNAAKPLCTLECSPGAESDPGTAPTANEPLPSTNVKECAICGEAVALAGASDCEPGLGPAHRFSCCQQEACVACSAAWIRAWKDLPGQRARIRREAARPTCPFCRSELPADELEELCALSGTTVEEALSDSAPDHPNVAAQQALAAFLAAGQRGEHGVLPYRDFYAVHPDFVGVGGVEADAPGPELTLPRVRRPLQYRYATTLRWGVLGIAVVVAVLLVTSLRRPG